MISLLVGLLAFGQKMSIHEVEKLPGFEIQGVAFTVPKGKAMETCVRVKGKLQLGGVWCLRVSKVESADDSPSPFQQSMANSMDVNPNGSGTVGYSPLKGDSAPESVRLEGELVHYRSIEESASFPSVRLMTYDKHPDGVGHNREWFVPDGCKATATTERGLVLRYVKLTAHGGSGPLFHDMSLLPVGVDRATLNAGIERELTECSARTVDRVDGYVNPDYVIPLMDPRPAYDLGLFAFRDEMFSRDVQLSLKVIRRIVDRRIKFTFVLPVQAHKNLDEEHTGIPNPDRYVNWPSAGKPTVVKRRDIPPLN